MRHFNSRLLFGPALVCLFFCQACNDESANTPDPATKSDPASAASAGSSSQKKSARSISATKKARSEGGPEQAVAAATVVTEEDRIEVYAEVLRQLVRKERDPRSGVVVDPRGLTGLDDQHRREVLVAVEDVAPEMFFGTREEIEAEQKAREESRAHDNERKSGGRKKSAGSKRDRGGSSSASTPVQVSAIEDDQAPILVLSLNVSSFKPNHASIQTVAWHAESGEHNSHFTATRAGNGKWRVRSGNERPRATRPAPAEGPPPNSTAQEEN